MAVKVPYQNMSKFDRFMKEHCSVEKKLHPDISKGKEYYPISIVNGVDNEAIPSNYSYIVENCETKPIDIERTITSLAFCECEDNCTSESCMCASVLSLQNWYDANGRLIREFNFCDPPMIFECNRACKCWQTCSNRVVSNKSRCRLQVYRSPKNQGWSVRTLKDIPRGSFVCEYVGELIPDCVAEHRDDDSYLFDLDHRDGESLYCLDARHYGNVARFINHICEPNLTPVKVFVDHQDMRFPRMALFANRDIRAYEELGFDYGENFWVIKSDKFTCECGTASCKYSESKIQTTLEHYYRRIRDDQMDDDVSGYHSSSGSDITKNSTNCN